MAIKDMKNARRARNIGIIWTLFAYVGALALGWIGIALFGPQGLSDQEFVMPMVILEVFPPAIAGLLITGVIAAIVSSADSLLIVSSTELSENIIKPFFKRPFSDKGGLALSRLITLALAIIALAMAYGSPSGLIFTMVSYVWAGIGGTFSVVILLTLFWKRYHGRAVIVTIVTGLLFTIIWISSGMEQQVTSRLLNFFVTGAAAILATYLLPEKKNS
jgi:sodium/proline symporter